MAKERTITESNSMEHCNGDQIVAIEIATTGKDPYMDEIIHISAIALRPDLSIRRDVIPFSVNLVPHYPERIDAPSAHVLELLSSGHDKDKAADLFQAWKKKLKFEATQFGREKKIIPLAYNYAFQRPFIQRWLTPELYDELFVEYHNRDVLQTACYLNEQASFHCRRVPYSKYDLPWIAKQHKVEAPSKAHCIQRAKAVAEIYKAQCLSGLL